MQLPECEKRHFEWLIYDIFRNSIDLSRVSPIYIHPSDQNLIF